MNELRHPRLWCVLGALAFFGAFPAPLIAQNPAYLTVGSYNLTLEVQQHPSIATEYRVKISATSSSWPGWINISAGNANGLTDINNWGAAGGNSFDTNNRADKYSPYFTPTNPSFQWTWSGWQHGPEAGPVSGTFTLEGNLVQEVSLSPNEGNATLIEGQTFNGTATGAQAGNAYNISIVSGPGSAAINSSTGAYTVTANGVGAIAYKVWISAGGGYARSEDAVRAIVANEGKKVTVRVPANTGDKPVTYDLVQDGQVIGSRVQQPGDGAYVVQVNVGANAQDVVLRSTVSGVAYDDGVLVDDVEGAVQMPQTQTISPSDDTTPVDATITTSVKTAGSDVTTQGRTKVVWGDSGQSTNPAEQTDLLTNKTYREGVERLTELDTLALDARQKAPKESDMAAQGQAAKDAAAASVEGIAASISAGSAPAPITTSPNFSGSVGQLIENQWNAVMGYVDPVVQWVNVAIRWLIAVGYTLWVMKELDRKLVASMMLPQAKGNTVAAGTGAQITSLAAAALISGALLTLPVLLWTAYLTPWETLMGSAEIALTSVPAFPTAGPDAVELAMGWLSWVLPLDMLIAIPSLVILTRKAGWAIILGVAAVVRFIVP